MSSSAKQANPATNTVGGGAGAFLTQKSEKIWEVKKDIEELENLLSGAAQTSQSTLLLKKRKEMREVDDSLELMKSDYKKRMDECEERRLQFEIKQAKMREQVLKFEKFIQENDAKRQRAEAKAKMERRAFEDQCRELNSLANHIVEMELQQRLLHEELTKKSCYKEFLERIVEEGEYGYEEISDVLGRYKTLKDANKDLMKVSNEQDKDVDEMRKMLMALKTEAQNHLLVSNSFLHSNQKDLEGYRSNVKLEEEETDQVEEKKKDISREFSQVTQAIRNIFSRCQSSMRNKAVFVGSKESSSQVDMLNFNLDLIHARIVDLIEISNEYKEDLASNSLLFETDLREGSLANPSVFTGVTGAQTSGSKSGILRPLVSISH